MSNTYRNETNLLHAGYRKDPATNSVALPIYQTASYEFDSTEHAASLFALKEFGNIYTRLMNPTTDVLEKRVAEMDGGAAALALSSGSSAVSMALLNIAQSGDEIVSLDNLYGGTYNLFHYTFPRLGVTVKFANSADFSTVEAAITEKTKALYCETIGNPKLNVTDIEALAAIAHKHNLPLVIDNTAAPFICRPIDHDADIVVYSATKFMGGHGTSIGGLIVDSAKFDWTVKNSDGTSKFPLIADPDPSYHGVNFIEALAPIGNIAYIIKARVTLLRDMGPAISPFNAFQIVQGLETLHIRMERHVENAKKVAAYLEKHPKVKSVIYPGLDSSSEKIKSDKYFTFGPSGLVGFEIDGPSEKASGFIDSLQLIYHLANIGDTRTLAIHPASTTHSQLSAEEQAATGVTPGFVRLSVGIEHIDDIIADIDQALQAI